MADIVLVHGAFHELWGPARLGLRWAPCLLDGMWVAGVDTRAISLVEFRQDLEVAFWGDLFRPAPLSPAEVAAATGGEERPGLTTLADRITDAGAGALDALGQALAAETQRRTLELLTHYFTDPELRDTVHRRVSDHLSHDTKVVVAHSMGTVVAYEALCANPDVKIDLFVTLGSPLAAEGLVFDNLAPAPVGGLGVWPPGVERWVNVAAEADLATMSAPRLAPRFGDEVRDEYVFNGKHPHDIEPYLTAPETGAPIARALGYEVTGRRSQAEATTSAMRPS